MASRWDVRIQTLYVVDDGTFFTVDDVENGSSFDVIARIEVGENLNEVVDDFYIRVAIRNLTQSNTIAIEGLGSALTPANNTPLHEEVRVDFDGGWDADVGDVLQAVASFRLHAGVNTVFSTAESNVFVVS